MKDDTISRQAAIDTLNVGAELLKRVLDDADIIGVERAKYEWGLELIESYISDMKDLPSAQPEPDWIPIEKEMPNNDDAVLITHSQGVTKAWWNGRYWTNGMTKKFKTVLAWMPLPKPYKKRIKENRYA